MTRNVSLDQQIDIDPNTMPASLSEAPSSAILIDAHLRSVLENCTQTREQCMKLIDRVQASAVAKGQGIALESQAEISQRQKALHSRLGELRGLNRNAILQVRNTKQETSEARQEIDRLHLQLQNLYYEERHLKGEIASCENYDHKYQQLPLIPVGDFLQKQPEHTSHYDDEKTLMFARINDELQEREALEKQRQGLLTRKQTLIAENKKRKEDLASLDQDLEKFIDAAKPIQKIFEKQY